MNPCLLKLYSELDYLYRDIKLVCCNCHDHDCEGYVWLLEEEADLLFNLEVPIIEINDTVSFIHSFEENEGVISVDKPRPPCRLRQSGLCSIYNSRPLVCRMYPVGPVTDKGEILIVLHKDCKFSRNLQDLDRRNFYDHFLTILRQTPKSLLDRIINTYRQVDALSAFPEGSSTFEVIIPLRLL